MRCLFLAAVLAIPCACFAQQTKGTAGQTKETSRTVAKKLTPEELGKLLEDGKNLFFLDVREPDEIKEKGSIAGYVNIPLGQLESRLNEIPKDKLIITA